MMIPDLRNIMPTAAAPGTRTNGTKRPIGWPTASGVDALCKTRANDDNAAWQRQQERLGAALHAAATEGHAQGERDGYRQGVRWGLACGAIAGSLGMACAWVGVALLRAMGG